MVVEVQGLRIRALQHQGPWDPRRDGDYAGRMTRKREFLKVHKTCLLNVPMDLLAVSLDAGGVKSLHLNDLPKN